MLSEEREYLEGRESGDVTKVGKINSDVGRTRAIDDAAPDPSTSGGFKCDVCGTSYNDSSSYLEHLNSKGHLANIGISLNVKRSSFDEVKERLSLHINRYLENLSGRDKDKPKVLFSEKVHQQTQQRVDRRRKERQLRKKSKLEEPQQNEENEEMMKTLGFASFV